MYIFISFKTLEFNINNITANRFLKETIAKIDGAYSAATIRAYRADFLHFINFCESINEDALPASPEPISGYITQLVENKQKSASIRRAIAGIASIHIFNNYQNPTINFVVKLSLKRMHRQIGRNSKQALALTRDILDEMLLATDDSIRGQRNQAMLLVAYDTMCRRGELVNMRVEDLSTKIFDRKNNILSTVIQIRQSKTDQESQGRWLSISANTATALNNWLKVANIDSGYIFRGISRGNKLTDALTPGQISRIYKSIALNANLDKEMVAQISGHSIRVGAAQDLLLAGATLPMIMARGRWSKPDTVMRYVEKIGIPL